MAKHTRNRHDAKRKINSLPQPIREARRQAGSKVRQQRRSRPPEIHWRSMFAAWERIFESLPTGHHNDQELYEAWLRGWAQRLASFGREVSKAGLANNALAIKSDDLANQIALELLKTALSGDAEPVLKLLRDCPKPNGNPERWWPRFFNHDLPLQIYDPEMALRQTRNCLCCSAPLSEWDIQDRRGVCHACRGHGDKMGGLWIAVRTAEAGPENPDGPMARVGDIGRQIRALSRERFGHSLSESELLERLEDWLLAEEHATDRGQLASVKLSDVLMWLNMATNKRHIAPAVDRAAIADYANRCDVPVDILLAIPGASNSDDWAAAVYVYQLAKNLPPKVPKPTMISFAKLELAIGERHDDAWQRNGITPFELIPFEDPRYEISKRIDSEFHHELATLRSLMPPATPTPPGWEGEAPSREIESLQDLCEYLESGLNFLRKFGFGKQDPILMRLAFDRAAEEIRNAFRVFDHLKITDRPPWPADAHDAHAAERALSDLIHWLRPQSRATTFTDLVGDSGPVGTPSNADAPAELADPIEEALSGQPLKLYQFLRVRTCWTLYATLSEQKDFWRTNSPDFATIHRALRRLQDELNSLPIPPHLKIEHQAKRVRLDKSVP